MLTQLSTVRARLGLTELEVQWDTLLVNIIAAVSARFDRECNRVFPRTEHFAQEFCAGDREVILRCHPLETVERFEIKTAESTGWETVEQVEHMVRRRCVLTLAARLGSDAQQGRVIYTGGYVLPGGTAGPGQAALPADLEYAAVEQVCFWFLNRERLGLTRQWEYHGTYRQFADLDLLTPVRGILASYAVF